jgi:predicted metal-dependent phosphoesterase TrpH
LTDHDELGGQADAAKAAAALGLDYVSGVEISVSFLHQTVHIVGLGVDANDPSLIEGLRQTRGGRDGRAHRMAEQLQAVGISGCYEGALRYAGNPNLIARTHFARYLVERGICRDTNDVFRHYLGDGKPGFVPHAWATLRDAVHWIRTAHGVAVLAHPARYRLTANEQYALFGEFKEHGGLGVEVITGSHTSAEALSMAELAREFGLAASRGSDFHSPDEGRVDLGTLPALPSDLTPVWRLLEHRIQHAPQRAPSATLAA